MKNSTGGQIVLALTLLLAGCASHPPHPKMTKPMALGQPQWQCDQSGDCQLVQMWKPSQLTSVGCVLHEIVTFGHVPLECKDPKKADIRPAKKRK